MILIEELYEFTFEEGMLYFADPSVFLKPKEMAQIKRKISEINSLTGYYMMYNGCEMLLVDLIGDMEYGCYPIFKNHKEIDESVSSSGNICIFDETAKAVLEHKNKLEEYVSVELEESADIKVAGLFIEVGDIKMTR
jgi:hypothetical protein